LFVRAVRDALFNHHAANSSEFQGAALASIRDAEASMHSSYASPTVLAIG
jgi:hypothetical protein